MSKIVSVQTLQQEKVSRGTQLGQLLLPWLFPIGLIVLWQIASSTGLLESRILPAPTAVVSAFWNLLLKWGTMEHVQVSAGRAFTRPIGGWGSRSISGFVKWFIENGVNSARHHSTNDPQYSCTGTYSVGDLMVRD